MNQLDILLSKVVQLKIPDGRPLLIAISGFGGSGKSTLAAQIKTQLGNAEVVSMDAFGIDRLSVRSENWDSFDRGRLVSQVLKPASQGDKIKYEEYDFDKNEIIGWKTTDSIPYLIIEGCSCMHPDLLKYYDFTIWINCPLDLATQRGLARDRKWGYDSEVEWQTIWMPNEQDFFTNHRPDQLADFIYAFQGNT